MFFLPNNSRAVFGKGTKFCVWMCFSTKERNSSPISFFLFRWHLKYAKVFFQIKRVRETRECFFQLKIKKTAKMKWASLSLLLLSVKKKEVLWMTCQKSCMIFERKKCLYVLQITCYECKVQKYSLGVEKTNLPHDTPKRLQLFFRETKKTDKWTCWDLMRFLSF